MLWDEVITTLSESMSADTIITGDGIIRVPKITKVIFNEPATIIIWDDGTKTVVKCGDRDVYDPEKGFALCFMKKILGNTGRYYETIKRALTEYERTQKKENSDAEADIEV